jgi:hypothetical protein
MTANFSATTVPEQHGDHGLPPEAPMFAIPATPTLGQLVACVGNVVALSENLLWRLTVLKLVAAADETRFVARAAADVDVAASELAGVEQGRSELIVRLGHESGVEPAELTLASIAQSAPEGVAAALNAHRRKLALLTGDIAEASAQIRKHIGVSLRHLDAVLGEARGLPSTYTADGRTSTGPARPRLHRSF